jgi:hypothetical protein
VVIAIGQAVTAVDSPPAVDRSQPDGHRSLTRKLFSSTRGVPYNAAGIVNAPLEGRMNHNEECFICRRIDGHENLGVWFIRDRRFPIHLECWLDW